MLKPDIAGDAASWPIASRNDEAESRPLPTNFVWPTSNSTPSAIWLLALASLSAPFCTV